MKLLVPSESRRAIRARRVRRRAFVAAAILAVIAAGVAGFYIWPHPSPPRGMLYQNTDGRVLASLNGFRQDHPPTRLDVRGRIWSYVRLGEGPEAVLFLHGMGGAHDIWWQQLRALQEQYTVLAITYPAEGDLSTASLALRSILDAEGIGPVHVVGTSMGGYLAQFFATQEPDRLRSLVLSNTFPPGNWIESEYGTMARLLPFAPSWVPGELFRRTIRESIFPASGGSHLVRGYLLEQSYRMTKSDFRARLAILRVPFAPPELEGASTLIIEADNDPSVPPAVRAALTATYPEVPVVTMNEVGHFPYLNRPAAYTSILEDFWAGLRPPADSIPQEVTPESGT